MRYFYVLMSWMLGVAAVSGSAEARTIYFGTDTEIVPLIYGGPTILRFPMEVRTISQAQKFEITPTSADSPNYAVLSANPRFTSGSSDVAFILSALSRVRFSPF